MWTLIWQEGNKLLSWMRDHYWW